MQEPIEEFLAEERAKNLSDGTLRHREMVMKWLDEWTEKDVRNFDRGDIRDFLVHLQDRGACDGTVANYMGQVTKLFDFLQAEGEISEENNPRKKIQYNDYLDTKTTEAEKVMRERKSYIALSEEEAEKLLANATAPKVRNTLMMKLQLETGPRAGELVRVRLGDIDLDEQTVQYNTLKKDTTEYRTLGFSRGVKRLLNQWLNEGYRERFKSANNSDYVFVSRSSEKMTVKAYNEVVKKAATEAGIQEKTRVDSNDNQEWKVRSHVLRHTYAETMVRNGCDISRLADLMGHDTIETTRKYLDHDEETLLEAQRKFSPSFSA
jgi:integrase/recombinase XerD